MGTVAPEMKLTAAAIEALRPPACGRVTYWDAALPGFGLCVAAGGACVWLVQYRAGGRLRRLELGRHPSVSPGAARARARAALAGVVSSAARACAAPPVAPTFERVAREYIERHAKVRKRSWREDVRILERYVLPSWGARRAAAVTARDVRRLVDGIVDRGAPIQANRTFALVRRVFNWAAAPDRGLVPQSRNPCRGLERPAPERPRERVLSARELRALWRALEHEDVETAALFKLHLLTAQRDGELRTMMWRDVDLDAGWWTIPGERAKNGRSHRVPLSPPAVAVLRGLAAGRAGGWVFPSPRRSASGHRQRVYKAVHRIRRASGIADFTPHDLRRTAASHMTSVGIARLTVAKLLNHAERGVTAVYDRHGYDREKREAVVAWAEELGRIVRGEGGGIGFRVGS